MFRIIKTNSGSSLVDVLMANFLMIIGVFAVLSPVSIGMRHLNDSDRTSIAMNLARSTMENAMSANYGTVASSFEGYGSIPGYPDFKRIVVVQENTPVNYVKLIRVAVLWAVPGAKESTSDGLAYDPLNPDAHRAFVVLVIMKEAPRH
jgi:hypothetical protein